MERIIIKNLIGDKCLSQEQGERLYNTLLPIVQRGEEVCLDFEGVQAAISLCFNHGIGRLLETIKPAEFDRLVKTAHLRLNVLETYNRVVNNAKQYYHDPKVRRAADEALLSQLEEEPD